MDNHKVPKRIKDKSDRATHDTVLDRKTVHILKRLVDRGMLTDLCGCISTGKEANVYKARVSPLLACKMITAQEIMDNHDIINIEEEKLDDAISSGESVEMNDNFENLNGESSCDNNSNNSVILNEDSHSTDSDENDLDVGNFNSKNSATENNETENELLSKIDYLTINNTTNLVPCAIKIYQTSIMLFKDRLKYIQSEPRYKIFCSTNPRKLVKLWAEKEVRNLKRLNKHKIPSPTPIYLKNNILIMTLITSDEDINNSNNPNTNNHEITDKYYEDSNEENESELESNPTKGLNKYKSYLQNFSAAPRLKDAKSGNYQDLYIQAIQLIKDMYQKCNLVHADLSEYNLLVKNNRLIVIDVGQSVERSHVNAFEFLIMDIKNINKYFEKRGCKIILLNKIFEDITGKFVPICMDGLEMNRSVYVPERLSDVVNEEDRKTYLKDDINNENIPEVNNDDDSSNYSDNISDSSSSMLDENMEQQDLKQIRKDNKKTVKELQREKRKSKMPKKEKRKKEKLNKNKKKN